MNSGAGTAPLLLSETRETLRRSQGLRSGVECLNRDYGRREKVPGGALVWRPAILSARRLASRKSSLQPATNRQGRKQIRDNGIRLADPFPDRSQPGQRDRQWVVKWYSLTSSAADQVQTPGFSGHRLDVVGRSTATATVLRLAGNGGADSVLTTNCSFLDLLPPCPRRVHVD